MLKVYDFSAGTPRECDNVAMSQSSATHLEKKKSLVKKFPLSSNVLCPDNSS